MFCDLRGCTSITEGSEPEEAMNVLREYHAALGELILRYEGTLDRYAGDGVMILFNAPIPFADHTQRAIRMAVEMRDSDWTVDPEVAQPRPLVSVSASASRIGYATLGQVGFERRLEYAAIGSVTNLASRLCDEAKAGQIVVNHRVYGMVEPWVEASRCAISCSRVSTTPCSRWRSCRGARRSRTWWMPPRQGEEGSQNKKLRKQPHAQ